MKLTLLADMAYIPNRVSLTPSSPICHIEWEGLLPSEKEAVVRLVESGRVKTNRPDLLAQLHTPSKEPLQAAKIEHAPTVAAFLSLPDSILREVVENTEDIELLEKLLEACSPGLSLYEVIKEKLRYTRESCFLEEGEEHAQH